MSAADLASAGRPPGSGGQSQSASSSSSNSANGARSGSIGRASQFPPLGPPHDRLGQYSGNSSASAGFSGPLGGHANDASRSGTPLGKPSRGGNFADHFTTAAGPPPLAAPRPVPPFQRLTSPTPQENLGRSPSPTKGSNSFVPGYGGKEARERWSSIAQIQTGAAPAQPMGGPFDGAQPPQRPQSSHPPFMAGPPSAGGPGSSQDPFFGYGDFFGSGSAGGNVHHRGGGPGADNHFSMAQHPEDARFDPGYPSQGQRFGQRDGRGQPSFGDPNAPPPGSMSPRSMMHFHSQQMQHVQMAAHAGAGGNHHLHHNHQHHHQPQGPGAQSLGSGLMSNSGQPAEEITTVFIVGFPDDMTERELANMFLFAKGFEASTLKIPAGGPTPGSGSSLQREMGGPGGPMGGAGGPYNAVNMPSGNFYEGGSANGWDDHALNMALSRGGPNDPFNLSGMGNALGGMGTLPAGAAANAAGKIKQIIGFAKFRTRGEALEARDALNGKKIDAERGCVLKTEMAKKNLHTKQKPVLPGAPGPSEGGPFSSGGHLQQQQQQQQGPGGLYHDGSRQGGNGAGGPSSAGAGGPGGGFPSSFPPSGNAGAHSFDSFARVAGPPSSSLSSMISPQAAEAPGPFGSDVFGRTSMTAYGGMSLAPVKTPGEGSNPRSAAADKWSSMGPLDYFGPVSENKRGEDAHGTSISSAPRGPDWSAIGSPPGLYSTSSKSSGTDASARGGAGASSTTISPSKQSTNSNSSSSSHHYQDFGMGEPMTTITTPTTSRAVQGQRRDTHSSTTSAGSFSGSPTKSGRANTGDSSHESTSPPSAVETPTSSYSTGSAAVKGATTPGGGSGPRSNGSSYEAASHDRPGVSSSNGPKSPVELPSPTSRSFSIDQNPPGNTLFVGNLPSNSSASTSASLEDQLRQRFSACTGYRQLSFRVKNNGPMCFVEFDDVQNAARALAEVNGDSMNGAVKNGGLRLSFSKNPLFRNSCSSGNAVIGGAVTPTSPTPTPASSTTTTTAGGSNANQYESLGKLGENMRKQPSLSSVASSAKPAEAQADPFDTINTLEESAYRDGFQAGSAHGKLHGTFEGRQLGREKGFEIWDEVGFYEGTARFWKGVLAKQIENVPAPMRSRKQMKQLQHLNGLETLIAAFPTKNRSGAQLNPPPPGSILDTSGSTAPEGDDEMGGAAGEQDDPEALAKLDMSVLLERIRARYKTVCASLGIPARGLEAAAAGGEEGVASTPASSATDATTVDNNKNAAVIGGKVVDTTQLRF